MFAQNRFDGFRGLIGVVKGDGGDEMVKDVRFDDAMHEIAADESKFTIDCGGCTTCEIPRARLIVRKGWVSVLKEGDPNYRP